MFHDAGVLEILSGADTLLDSQLRSIVVEQSISGGAIVELGFNAREGSRFSFVKIKFTDVFSFEFSYEDGQSFLDVWELKFIRLSDESFYITLDPDPSTLASAGVSILQDSETDRFYVRARHIEAIVTPI